MWDEKRSSRNIMSSFVLIWKPWSISGRRMGVGICFLNMINEVLEEMKRKPSDDAQ